MGKLINKLINPQVFSPRVQRESQIRASAVNDPAVISPSLTRIKEDASQLAGNTPYKLQASLGNAAGAEGAGGGG